MHKKGGRARRGPLGLLQEGTLIRQHTTEGAGPAGAHVGFFLEGTQLEETQERETDPLGLLLFLKDT